MSGILNSFFFFGSGGGFVPTNEATLDLWLQGDNATISGVPEFDWPDSSSAGKHYGQNTVARQPTITGAIYNGHKAVRFTNNKDLVPDPNALFYGTANTMIVVCTKSTAAEYIFSGTGLQGGPAFISLFSPDFEYFYTGLGGHERATFAASTDSNLHILTLTKTDNAGNYVGYLDGTQVFSNAIHADDDWSASSLNTIGALTRGSSFLNADIAEIIHCSSVLGSTQLTNMHQYLGAKYAITVP